MSSATEGPVVPVTVQLLDREYTIGCPENEKPALLEAARLLNKHMREVRESGAVAGTDRIAIISALNITHELLQDQGSQTIQDHEVKQRIERLNERVALSLENFSQLEIS